VPTPPCIIIMERPLPWAAPLLILITTVLVLEYVWRPSTEAYSNSLPLRPSGVPTANVNGNDAVDSSLPRVDGVTGRQGVPTPGRASPSVALQPANGHSHTGAEKT